MCILQLDGYVITSLAVDHSLRKECYELPPFPLRFDSGMDRESCGLRFDTSTNTWKMVCVLLKEYAPPDKPDMVKKNLCTMPYLLMAVCFGWLVILTSKPEMVEENCYYNRLVDLNGKVGYVGTETMEFWLLNHKKEWVPHCRFKEEIVPNGFIPFGFCCALFLAFFVVFVMFLGFACEWFACLVYFLLFLFGFCVLDSDRLERWASWPCGVPCFLFLLLVSEHVCCLVLLARLLLLSTGLAFSSF
ncbi:hypothetical protein Tco_1331933 [Tanacetum coccineum]